MNRERVSVSHSDGHEVEIVRDLSPAEARRLIEHELAAGRQAFYVPNVEPRTTYR